MTILGLTGSIGMGKSTTAALFREAGVPVFDSDAAVHALYRGEAVPLIAARFPGVVQDGTVDRARLGAFVLRDADALQRLETLVHPLVRQRQEAFRAASVAAGHRLLVFYIPLLFETGARDRVDLVVVVSAPEAVQKARVLARPGMTEEKLAAILAKQLPDRDKRRQAHAVIETGFGLEPARRAVNDLIRAVAAMA